MEKLTFIATGDSFITRRFPQGGYAGFDQIRDVISRHDIKFSNLEMTFHNSEGTPSATSGGTWAMAEPRCLDDMRSYGFNLFTTANNHSGDYGEGGVLATIRHMRERDMVFSGTGANLAEASRACYLETSKARVALISACSTFHAADAAGGQSGEMTGRPGLNPLRFTTTYHVTEEAFNQVKALAALTYVNAYEDYGIKLGYVNPKPEGITNFGAYNFALDTEEKIVTAPAERDMKRIEEEIREAARQADVVLVSIHAHETDKDDFATPAGYLRDFSRRCIEAGAQAVIGHGPHELRGIELYKGGVILYSLGNFLFETETVSLQPCDAFGNKGMPADTKVGAYMDTRSKNGTVGYPTQENIWRSVMAGWTVEDGRITQLQLYPISLEMGLPRSRRGVPVVGDSAVLEYLAGLCEPFGTTIRIENNVGYIDIAEV